MIFLYELFINSDEYKLELEFEEKLKKLKKINQHNKNRVLIEIFCDSKNTQNVHTNNYWEYILKDHIGLDVFGHIPELIDHDKFNGTLEFG